MAHPLTGVDLPLTTGNIVLAFREFLTVWIYLVIYYNDVYPESVFELTRHFDILVYTSRNPSLLAYISKVTLNCLAQFGFVNDDESHQDNPFVEESLASTAKVLLVAIFSLSSTETKKKYNLGISDLIAGLAKSIDTKTLLATEMEMGVDEAQSNSKSSLVSIPGVSWSEMYAQFKSLLYEHSTELKRSQQLSRKVFGIQANNLFFRIYMQTQYPLGKDKDDWVRESKKSDLKARDFVAVGQVDAAVFSVALYNEYIDVASAKS